MVRLKLKAECVHSSVTAFLAAIRRADIKLHDLAVTAEAGIYSVSATLDTQDHGRAERIAIAVRQFVGVEVVELLLDSRLPISVDQKLEAA